MARVSKMVGGYPHTPAMRRANGRIRHSHGCTLRAWILRWKADNPRGAVEDLADALNIYRGTAYDWLRALRIDVGGPVLIDLDAERQAMVVADAAAAVAEPEGDAPRTGSDG